MYTLITVEFYFDVIEHKNKNLTFSQAILVGREFVSGKGLRQFSIIRQSDNVELVFSTKFNGKG